jgi:hypothetical protein
VSNQGLHRYPISGMFDRNSALAATRWKNVPQQFTNAKNQMLLLHRCTPNK